MAYWTAEGLLPRMSAKVSSEVGSLGEGLSTHVTAIWFLPRVGSHVRLERGWAGITLATYLTDVIARLAGSLVTGF